MTSPAPFHILQQLSALTSLQCPIRHPQTLFRSVDADKTTRFRSPMTLQSCLLPFPSLTTRNAILTCDDTTRLSLYIYLLYLPALHLPHPICTRVFLHPPHLALCAPRILAACRSPVTRYGGMYYHRPSPTTIGSHPGPAPHSNPMSALTTPPPHCTVPVHAAFPTDEVELGALAWGAVLYLVYLIPT